MKIILTEDQYNELNVKTFSEFLYKFWNSEKKRGEEPTLDDIVYQMSGVKKGSEEDIRTIRPIWYEYNGGYDNLLEKLKEEILYKELSFEGNQNLKLTFMVDEIESYGDGSRWGGEVDISCVLLNGTVDGYVYNYNSDEMVMKPNMDIGDQYAELEYDTQDFESFLKDEIQSFLDPIMERYGIPYHLEMLV
jgi:hypothetical protein